MTVFIRQKLMSRTYSCVRELRRSYSRSIVGIVNYSTYTKLSCNFAVDGRPKARFEDSNVDCSFFHEVLKSVKRTFLFEFKIKQRLYTLFFDITDRALDVQFADIIIRSTICLLCIMAFLLWSSLAYDTSIIA